MDKEKFKKRSYYLSGEIETEVQKSNEWVEKFYEKYRYEELQTDCEKFITSPEYALNRVTYGLYKTDKKDKYSKLLRKQDWYDKLPTIDETIEDLKNCFKVLSTEGADLLKQIDEYEKQYPPETNILGDIPSKFARKNIQENEDYFAKERRPLLGINDEFEIYIPNIRKLDFFTNEKLNVTQMYLINKYELPNMLMKDCVNRTYIYIDKRAKYYQDLENKIPFGKKKEQRKLEELLAPTEYMLYLKFYKNEYSSFYTADEIEHFNPSHPYQNGFNGDHRGARDFVENSSYIKVWENETKSSLSKKSFNKKYSKKELYLFYLYFRCFRLININKDKYTIWHKLYDVKNIEVFEKFIEEGKKDFSDVFGEDYLDLFSLWKSKSDFFETSSFKINYFGGKQWIRNVTNAEELKKEYRKLVKKYHPDENSGNAKIFEEIQKEYLDLKDNSDFDIERKTKASDINKYPYSKYYAYFIFGKNRKINNLSDLFSLVYIYTIEFDEDWYYDKHNKEIFSYTKKIKKGKNRNERKKILRERDELEQLAKEEAIKSLENYNKKKNFLLSKYIPFRYEFLGKIDSYTDIIYNE